MWAKALALSLVSYVLADDLQQCLQCVQQNQKWCPESRTCGDTESACKVPITLSLNCPRLPDPAYAYNETFARYYITPLVAGVFPSTPEKCLKSQLPHVAFYKTVDVKCAMEIPDVNCHGYTAWDPVEKAIIIAFRGTDGSNQMTDEVLSFFEKRVQFFDNGHLFKYFHDAFFYLWNGGLEQQVRTLKYQYPSYKFYVTGHSLGASIACICASYLVKWNMTAPENLRLVTFGQPRTGDYEFAAWHEATFPYAYRIIHHRDPVPHIPPRLGPDQVFHHRYEVWYDNDMAVGSPYTVCQESDGDYCSNTTLKEISDSSKVLSSTQATLTYAEIPFPLVNVIAHLYNINLDEFQRLWMQEKDKRCRRVLEVYKKDDLTTHFMERFGSKFLLHGYVGSEAFLTLRSGSPAGAKPTAASLVMGRSRKPAPPPRDATATIDDSSRRSKSMKSTSARRKHSQADIDRKKSHTKGSLVSARSSSGGHKHSDPDRKKSAT